jgi:hypothetical protein
MRGAVCLLPQYAFMAWCSVEAQGQLYLYLLHCKLVYEYTHEILVCYNRFVLLPKIIFFDIVTVDSVYLKIIMRLHYKWWENS